MAANRFHFLGDLRGAAGCGPFEGHVLQEVGDAIFFFGLIARPGCDIGPDRDGFDTVHAFGDDG